VAFGVILIMLIPVYIAQRLAGGADVASRGGTAGRERQV
jgi:hypothetical protein